MERTTRNHHDYLYSQSTQWKCLCSTWHHLVGPPSSIPQSFYLNSHYACIEPCWLQTFALLDLSDISVDSVLKFLKIPFFQEINYVMAFKNMVLGLDCFFLDSRNQRSLPFFIKEKKITVFKIYSFLYVPWQTHIVSLVCRCMIIIQYFDTTDHSTSIKGKYCGYTSIFSQN